MPQCQLHVSAAFGFRKVIKKIFSELDETKSLVPIFPDTTWSPNECQRRATEPPLHVVAWVPPDVLIRANHTSVGRPQE